MMEGRRGRFGVLGLAGVGLWVGCSCDGGLPGIDASANDALTADVPSLANCGPPETSFEDGPYPASARETPLLPLGPRPEGDQTIFVPRIADHFTQDTGMYWLLDEEAPLFTLEISLGTAFVPENEHWTFSLYVDGVPVPVSEGERPLVQAVVFDENGRANPSVPLGVEILPDGAHTVHWALYNGVRPGGGFGLTVYRNSHAWSAWENSPGSVTGPPATGFLDNARLSSGRSALSYTEPTDGGFDLVLGAQPNAEDVIACPTRPQRFVFGGLLDGYPHPFGPDPRGALFGETLGNQRRLWENVRVDGLPSDGSVHRFHVVYFTGLHTPNEERLGTGLWTPGTGGQSGPVALIWPVPS